MHRSAVLALLLLLTPLATMGQQPAQPKLSSTAMQWNGGIAYGYDGTGNVIRIGSDIHVYDGAGRLVLSETDGIRRTYSYDGFGNRTACVQAGPSDCQFGGTITGANIARNRMDGYSYDAAGNVTGGVGFAYSYDALNMQTRSMNGVATAEYIYTADDERIAIYGVTTGSWNWTLRDASAKVLREFTSRNGTGNGTLGTASWTWTKDYFWRDNLLLATRQTEPGASSPVTYHYHLDHLGTPRRITNDANQIVGEHNYHPFGPETSGGTNEPSPTRLKYTGHERDGELDYMHARYYDQKMGRFLSVDPWAGMLTEPQTLNRYAYVVNDPVNYVDMDGLQPCYTVPDEHGVGGKITICPVPGIEITVAVPSQWTPEQLRARAEAAAAAAKAEFLDHYGAAMTAWFVKFDGPSISKHGTGRIFQLRFGSNPNKPIMFRLDYKSLTTGGEPKLHINIQQQGKGERGFNKHINIDPRNLLKGLGNGLGVIPRPLLLPLLNPCSMNPSLCNPYDTSA